MEVNLYGEVFKITRIELNRYTADNTLAIQLYSFCPDYGGFEEPFATLTVCLNVQREDFENDDDYEAYMKNNRSYLDSNNCPWGADFVKKYELGKPTGYFQISGYCTYDLYEWDLDKLKQYE